MSDPNVLVEARGLVKRFRVRGVFRRGHETRALDQVDVKIRRGEVVGLIGESGSGKTTLGKALLRLMRLDAGTVQFEGTDLFSLSSGALREHRRSFQMVFQNQLANLHPRMTVREMLDESLRLHRADLDPTGRRARIDELLQRVGLTERADQRPGSLSGGERRRAGLARILATKPKLIVADEPTSGLDAAIKLQMIELLQHVKDEDLAYLLISHDLGLVRRISDRVIVMLHGRIIEEVPTASLGRTRFHHPYTRRLIGAATLIEDKRKAFRDRRSLPRGFDPEALARAGANLHAGCVHVADCQLAAQLGILDRCSKERPAPVAVGQGHWVACFGAESPPEDPA